MAHVILFPFYHLETLGKDLSHVAMENTKPVIALPAPPQHKVLAVTL